MWRLLPIFIGAACSGGGSDDPGPIELPPALFSQTIDLRSFATTPDSFVLVTEPAGESMEIGFDGQERGPVVPYGVFGMGGGEHGWLGWTLVSTGVGIGRRTPAGAIEEWPADSDLTTYQSMHVAADGLYWIERGPENALSTWYWGEGEPTRLAVTTDELFHLTDVDEAHLYGGVGQSIVRIPKTGGDLEVLVEREEDQPVGPFALSRNRLIYTRGLTGAGVFEMDTSTVEERAVGELPESYPVGPITVGEPEVYVGRYRFADGERRTLLPEDEHDATFETPGAMIIRSVFLRGGTLYWLAFVGTEPEMGVPGPKTWSLYSTPK